MGSQEELVQQQMKRLIQRFESWARFRWIKCGRSTELYFVTPPECTYCGEFMEESPDFLSPIINHAPKCRVIGGF